jgi:hypothetical protein
MNIPKVQIFFTFVIGNLSLAHHKITETSFGQSQNIYVVRSSFGLLIYIGYKIWENLEAKGYGIKGEAIGNTLGNTLGTCLGGGARGVRERQ